MLNICIKQTLLLSLTRHPNQAMQPVANLKFIDISSLRPTRVYRSEFLFFYNSVKKLYCLIVSVIAAS